MSKYPYIGKLSISEDRFSIALLLGDGKGFLLENTIDDKDTLTNTDEFCDWTFTDITADYLRNTKVKIESLEHAKMIQSLIDKAGLFSFRAAHDDFLYISNSHNALNPKEITLPIPPKEEEMKKPIEVHNGTGEKINIETIDLGGRTIVQIKLKEDKEMQKPTYTKEMYERGELPPVGSEVMTSCGKAVINLPPDKVGFMIAETNGVYQTLTIGNVKPVSPVDELAAKIANAADSDDVRSTREMIAKAIINGDIDVSKYLGGE